MIKKLSDNSPSQYMQNTLQHDVVIEKTRELCESIVNQPEFQSMRVRIDSFIGDQAAQIQYQAVVQKGDALSHKQQMGMPLDEKEINDFETHREALLLNPIAREFIEAQEEMHKIQKSVVDYVSKTLQLGRVPAADELDGGGCGSGCGCHH